MSHSTDINQSADRESRQSSDFEPPEYRIFYGPDNTLHWEPTVGSAELAIALSYYFPLEKDLASKMRAATRKFLKSQSKKRRKGGEKGSVVQEQVLTSSATLQVSSSLPIERSMASRQNTSRSIARGQAISRSNSKPGDDDNSTLSQCPKEHQSYPLDSPQQVETDLLGIRTLTQPKNVEATTADEMTLGSFQILSWSPESPAFGKGRRKRPYEKDEKVQVAANRGYACEAHRRRKAKCDPDRCPNNGQNRKAVESRLEKRQRSISSPEPEPSKSASSTGSSSNVARNWAPQDLVCPSRSSTPDHDVNPSPHPVTSSSSSSILGPPWGPRNSSLFHTLYSPIWQLPWGYDDGRSWVMSPLPKREAKHQG